MRHCAPGFLLFLRIFAVPSWCAVTVILAPHAKVPPGETDTSLTAAGQTPANLRASTLKDVDLDTMIVSDFKRTQQTAQATKSHREGRKTKEGSQVMEISFVKSGGISPITRVQGTIHLNDGTAEVTGDASYHRQLARDEANFIQVGADPTLLSQAATAIANKPRRGMGDVDHYLITIKTADGATHQVSLNSSGGDTEGISPEAARFLSWVRHESQSILTHKMQQK